MTIAERDQFAMLQADWSPPYDITCDPDAPKPFQAIPRADPDTILQAGTPQELRVLVRNHHASRTGTTAGEATP